MRLQHTSRAYKHCSRSLQFGFDLPYSIVQYTHKLEIPFRYGIFHSFIIFKFQQIHTTSIRYQKIFADQSHALATFVHSFDEQSILDISKLYRTKIAKRTQTHTHTKECNRQLRLYIYLFSILLSNTVGTLQTNTPKAPKHSCCSMQCTPANHNMFAFGIIA